MLWSSVFHLSLKTILHMVDIDSVVFCVKYSWRNDKLRAMKVHFIAEGAI